VEHLAHDVVGQAAEQLLRVVARTPGQRPRDYAQELLGGLPDDVVRKVLHDNAAAVYGVK